MGESEASVKDPNMLAALIKKESDMKLAAEKSGGSTNALQEEARRQQRQALRSEDVTKSGEED